MVNNKVGWRIRQIRDSKGLTQESVADEIGMSFGNLGKIERSEVDPKTTSLYAIAKVLNVNVVDFFDDNRQVAEPKDLAGFATKEELKQAFREMQALFKAEFQKIREELALKNNSYKPKRFKRKNQ